MDFFQLKILSNEKNKQWLSCKKSLLTQSGQSQKVQYVPWLVTHHMSYTLVAPLPSIKRNE